MTWNTTQLIAGPLADNSYDYTIDGLSAGTTYKYRAYMVVDGVEYYGNVLTGRTCNIVLTLPSVTTGGLHVSTLMPTSFSVSNNNITSSGNTLISEYGLLYAQESTWGGNNTLIIDNNPLHNTKYCGITCVSSTPFTYTANLSGLKSNTTTFYRAYVKNTAGVAYGDVKTQITAAIMPNVITGGISHQSYDVNKFSISGNTISLLGDTLISEYGLLYTQESSWSDESKLTINNYPLHVKKYYKNQSVSNVPYLYTGDVNQTNCNDNVYYRAYVKNACGVVYGDIKAQAPINYEIRVHVYKTTDSCHPFGYGICGSYGIYCCDGTLVHNKITNDFDYSETPRYYMPNGCYYMDFNKLYLCDQGGIVTTDLKINGCIINSKIFNFSNISLPTTSGVAVCLIPST